MRALNMSAPDRVSNPPIGRYLSPRLGPACMVATSAFAHRGDSMSR
jgi:hypothetical protein